MDKQTIIDYVMHTPLNTNPAVLSTLLDRYSGLDISEEALREIINAYLEDNPLESVLIDTTLTQEGSAADAKAVGDKFQEYVSYSDEVVLDGGDSIKT